MKSVGYKRYWKIPFGEVQYGTLTGRVHIWFRGKCYRVF